jgi:branched-chain amino acid transport system permease protein
VILSVVNNYLLPDVLFDLPSKLGLEFDLSAISSGIYGAILVVVMLLRPQGLMPARRSLERSDNARLSLHRYDLSKLGGRARA